VTAGPSRLSLWAPVVACMALIFGLSSMSSPPSPGAVNDKVLHFAAYGGLAALCLRATSGGRLAGLTLRAGLLAWAVATAYGATDEFHQHFVPHRTSDIADLAADAAGAAAAVGLLGASGIIARSRGGMPPR
jgi:VanZ family protein